MAPPPPLGFAFSAPWDPLPLPEGEVVGDNPLARSWLASMWMRMCAIRFEVVNHRTSFTGPAKLRARHSHVARECDGQCRKERAMKTRRHSRPTLPAARSSHLACPAADLRRHWYPQSAVVVPLVNRYSRGGGCASPLEPPPTNDLCNSRLCRPRLRPCCDSGPPWPPCLVGGPEVVRVVLNSSSSRRPRLRPLR